MKTLAYLAVLLLSTSALAADLPNGFKSWTWGQQIRPVFDSLKGEVTDAMQEARSRYIDTAGVEAFTANKPISYLGVNWKVEFRFLNSSLDRVLLISDGTGQFDRLSKELKKLYGQPNTSDTGGYLKEQTWNNGKTRLKIEKLTDITVIEFLKVD